MRAVSWPGKTYGPHVVCMASRDKFGAQEAGNGNYKLDAG